MVKNKNFGSTIMLSLTMLGIITIQWWFWGYLTTFLKIRFSLVYSENDGPFLGDMQFFMLINNNSTDLIFKGRKFFIKK
jgi:ammonia channel protein AmtB